MSDSWQRISEIFHSALARSPGEREVFLDAACQGDDDLRRQIQSLLGYEGRSDEFLEPPSQPEYLLGRTFGIYEVLSVIGAGGMGVVYRARDTRLGRDVALKLLPPDMLDSGRRARFQREAHLLATLNHPNIATIFGMEEVDGVSALVLELIDGSTLAELIRQGPVPVPRALAIARQIADALKAAHARGVVHRDLKPANIGITQDGTVKVLDFGLAKAVVAASSGRAGATTIGAAAATVMLGTPGYMSPEQARGVGVDTRTDIWAFGCVCYEMLSGRPAFDGESVADVLAAVIDKEPDWSALPSDVPANARGLLRRCLSKDPSQRPTEVSAAFGPTPTRGGTSRARIAIAIATLLIAGLLAVSPMSKWLTRSDQEELVPVPLTSYPGFEEQPSFSPDGTQIAFQWNGSTEDNFDIYTKSIGAGEPRRLTTDPAEDFNPSWSPDGRWVSFGRINPDSSGPRNLTYVVPASGGAERFIAAGVPYNWSADSKAIVVGRGVPSGRTPGLVLTALDGQELQQLTTPVPPQLDLGMLSPDSHAVAIRRRVGATSIASMLILRFDDGFRLRGSVELPIDRRIRLALEVPFAWTPDGGDVVYAAGWSKADSYLWRVRADGKAAPVRLSFTGDGALTPAISRDGRLAYGKYRGEAHLLSLTLDDRGEARGPAVRVFSSSKSELCPAISPDGKRIAFESYRSGSAEIWTCAIDGGGCLQLTSGNGRHAGSPEWSPDGKWIAFDASGESGSEVYVIDATGGVPHKLARGVVPRWSRDQKWIYYTDFTADGSPPYVLHRIPATGGSPQRIEGTRGGWTAQHTGDGFLYFTDNPDEVRTRLRRIPEQGGRSEQLLDDVAGRNFVVTKNAIFYFASAELNQPNVLYFLDLKSGKSRVVYQTQKPIWPGMTMSPDGHHLIFAQSENRGTDLMLVEHFR